MSYLSQAFDTEITQKIDLFNERKGNTNVFDCVRDIVCELHAWETADALVRTGSYHVDMTLKPENWYIWRNGTKAPCYCDCRHLNMYPKDRVSIAEALAASVRQSHPEATLIVGMATAGISWARSVADNLRLPLAYVRSSPKKHGIGGLVECMPEPGAKAVLIDDLVASGDSLKTGMQALVNEMQIQTIGIQTIVNWGFSSMRSNLAGVPLKALTSFPYILTQAHAKGHINDSDNAELLAFYQNPKLHVWKGVTKH